MLDYIAAANPAFILELITALEEATKPVELSEAEVVTVARVLCKQHSDACGVDNHDAWNFYSDDFKRDAKEVLAAANERAANPQKHST